MTSILGESKQGYYDSSVYQYQFNCPYCADEKGGVDNKYNLEVSFALGKFHCWSCGNAGSLSKLIRARGGKPLVDEYFRIINDIKENKFYDLNLFKDNGDIFEEQCLKLPKTYRKIDISTCRDKFLVEYLVKRKITQDIIDFYNIFENWDNNNEEERGNTMEQLRAKKGFICDMDGVIYHGNRLLPGVKEFVDWLYREEK